MILRLRSWKGCKPNSVCPAHSETYAYRPGRQFQNERRRESFISAASTRNRSRPFWNSPSTPASFRKSGRGAGRSAVPYLALHPMGFSVPPRLRLERWALTPPFHLDHCPCEHEQGSLFSVALSVGTPHGVASRVHPQQRFDGHRGYAASRPSVFGLSSPRQNAGERFSALPKSIAV